MLNDREIAYQVYMTIWEKEIATLGAINDINDKGIEYLQNGGFEQCAKLKAKIEILREMKKEAFEKYMSF